jgi:hypothetical protein
VQTPTFERPIPFTLDRAMTELVAGRKHVSDARESLELAVRILQSLPDVGAPSDRELEATLGRLEEVEATLRNATA